LLLFNLGSELPVFATYAGLHCAKNPRWMSVRIVRRPYGAGVFVNVSFDAGMLRKHVNGLRFFFDQFGRTIFGDFGFAVAVGC
jgi:hypothetical protein